MAVTMLDIHLKHVIDYGFKAIRAEPDRYFKEIFGDAKLDPHASLYGARMQSHVREWFAKTKIPVILGFDLVMAELPAVTINLQGSNASDRFIGDTGFSSCEPLDAQNRQIVVPKFKPSNLEWSDDHTMLKLTLPEDMPFEQKELVLPGLRLRDNASREYAIVIDDNGDTWAVEASSAAPLAEIEPAELEVISPVTDARFNGGTMVFDETATIAIHGHNDRNEGLWLYYIVLYILLKYRPVLEQTFGLMLSTPSASDFSKDDSALGTNSWRRFISITSKSAVSWEAARQQDVIGLLLSVSAASSMTSNKGGNNTT